eukprot:scaffold2085_cov99-Isochrysis_galbana.AAC.3
MAALTALLLPSFLGWSPRTGLPPLGARSGRMAGPVARAAGAGGGMIDGVRIGPPPDMPSMLLNNRIVYLGSPINSQVSELIVGQLLFLQYDSTEQPITMYINSPGTTLEDGRPVGFETEAFAIADTMGYIKPQISTMLVGKAYGLAALLLASGDVRPRTPPPSDTSTTQPPAAHPAHTPIATAGPSIPAARQETLGPAATQTSSQHTRHVPRGAGGGLWRRGAGGGLWRGCLPGAAPIRSPNPPRIALSTPAPSQPPLALFPPFF